MGASSVLGNMLDLFEGMPGGMFIYEADGDETILYTNSKAWTIYGCETEAEFMELTGGSFKGMVHEDDLEATERAIRGQIDTDPDGYDHVFYRIRTKSGSIDHVEDFGRYLPATDERPALFVAFIADSKMRYYTAAHDRVTGLPGMRSFFDSVTDWRADLTGQAAIVYFNFANFKRYNSTFGIGAGDDALVDMSIVLRDVYSGCLISRLADDHFAVYCESDDVVERIFKVESGLKAKAKGDILHVRAGIRRIGPEDADMPVNMLCDQAKTACDEIETRPELPYLEYTSELDHELELRAHIVDNIDLALSEGWVQVFFQPVVRTLTGKMCGLEALARWNDPKYGPISPSVFVPALESARSIGKLDAFVVEEVCRHLRTRLDSWGGSVPVSVNLSRVDFETSSPFEVIEEIARKYRIPRDYLRVEITESTLMADRETVGSQIGLFQAAGYEVWMDDFGSGYSSLNVLKDFNFDEVKLDMMFMRNLDDRGREIVSSMIATCKRLGMKTLVEGVETKEQVTFLKSIGCDKIQGYFYGRPMSFLELGQHVRDFGVESEDRAEESMYDALSAIDFSTDLSLAIVEDDGELPRMLFANPKYAQAMQEIGISGIDEVNSMIDSPNFSMNRHYREMIDTVANSGEEETFIYADRGHYVRHVGQVVSRADGKSILRASLSLIEREKEEAEAQRYSALMQGILPLFNSVYLVDPIADTEEVLLSSGWGERTGTVFEHAAHRFGKIADMLVYEEDAEKYREFVNYQNMQDRLARRGKGSYSEWFRIKQPDGNYAWREISVIAMSPEPGSQMLVCIKDAAIEDSLDPAEAIIQAYSGYGELSTGTEVDEALRRDAELWRNLMGYSRVKYFWKDTERRFVGASKAFLDYYGFESVDAILGKTDEDMGWHADDEPFKNDEMNVLKRGAILYDVAGTCIVDGRLHRIAASKMPVYHAGRITGLVGYFVDMDKLEDRNGRRVDRLAIDPVTKAMSPFGITLALSSYVDGYADDGENFAMLLVDVRECGRLRDEFGKEVYGDALNIVAKTVMNNCGEMAALGRVGQSRFLVLERGADAEAMREHAMEMAAELHEVREIDGHACDPVVNYAIAYGAEADSVEGLVALIEARLVENIAQDDDVELFYGERITFGREKFDSFGEGVYMADPETYDMVYMNDAMHADLGLPADFKLEGHKCYKLLLGRDTPCDFCTNPLLRRDRFHTWVLHNPVTGKDYAMHDTLVPWRGKNYRWSMGTSITDWSRKTEHDNEVLYLESSTNDALEIALREKDPDVGINKLLERVGVASKADHVFICEISDDGDTVTASYEWFAPGVKHRTDAPHHLSKADGIIYNEYFARNEVVLIEDVETIRERWPQNYEHLASLGVQSHVAIDLKEGGRTIGMMGVDNPVSAAFGASALVLKNLAKFVSILLRNRDVKRKLENYSLHDPLTGVMNRRGLESALKEFDFGETLGIAYCDLNGLKEINDELGHDAGDALILKASNAMVNVAGTENVFRMGGDEFVVLRPVKNRSEASDIIAALREAFSKAEVSVAVGGMVATTPIENLDAAIKTADSRMYANKEHMHDLR